MTIKKMNRNLLPFRKNCEGYFINRKGKILAQDTQKGYIVFPGGGISKGESPEQAIHRETLEETGMQILNLTKVGEVKLVYSPDWAKTERQRQRYKTYKGEHLILFFGYAKPAKDKQHKNEEDQWQGEKFMSIQEAIQKIQKYMPKDSGMLPYHLAQINFLRNIQKQLESNIHPKFINL